jgi:ubiquinone/menaquinone biosynthesis C-methylase UbiE
MRHDHLGDENEQGSALNDPRWLQIHHHCKIRERTRMINDLELKGEGLVVDVGCGPGLWTELLACAIGEHGWILGVDLSGDALRVAERRSQQSWDQTQVRYVCTSLEHLPLQEAQADAIWSANVSQYLPDPVTTFAELGHFLKPGDMLAVKGLDFGGPPFLYH